MRMSKIKNEYIRRTSQVGTRQERFTLFNTEERQMMLNQNQKTLLFVAK